MHALPQLSNEISSASIFGNDFHVSQIRTVHLIELGEYKADDTKVSLPGKEMSLSFLTKRLSHAFGKKSALV